MNGLIKCLARFGAVFQSMLAIAIPFIFYLYINILLFVAIKIVISTRPSEFGRLRCPAPAPPGSPRRAQCAPQDVARPTINQAPPLGPVINMPHWAGLSWPRPPCPWGFLSPLQKWEGRRRELGGLSQPPDLSPSV